MQISIHLFLFKCMHNEIHCIVLYYAALLILLLSSYAPVSNYQTFAIIVQGFTQWKEYTGAKGNWRIKMAN